MAAVVPNLSRSPVESEVLRIRGLLESSRHAEALAAAEQLLATVPENRDVLYMVAVSQRYLRRVADALATLERLQRLHPRFSRLYQERGYCHVALREAAPATEAFLHAVNLNPALPGSWSMLKSLYDMTGQPGLATTAADHVATLARLPVDIVTATSMFADGEVDAAERVVRGYLLAQGNHVEGMRLLARIATARDVLDDAELLLNALLELAPDYHVARLEYARVLLSRHKHERALTEVGRLLKADPDNRVYRTLYATASVGVGNYDQAISLYKALLPGATQPAELHLSVAHALKTLGRQPEAIESYRAAAAARPAYGDAYWSLANLKTYRFSDSETARMRAEEAAATTTLVDRYNLCFALGKALEDRGEYAGSFDYYARGNALKKSEGHYQPEAIERNARLQAEVCTREFFATRAAYGTSSSAPIFIVGLPRAGSTLLEQILALHSQVEGTQELADIPRIAIELRGRAADPDNDRYPRVLAELKSEDCLRLGDKYLADTRAYRGDRPYFIDKMPNNFRHLGLIHLMLPNAKIIDARREPLPCCFSNFKQLFASGQEFTYSLEDIGRYYRSYVELMAHWDMALPVRVLRIQYELLVTDLDSHVRRILDFCGLEFEPACIEFYKTERSVRTASSEQVRQPIFRESLEQWRNFAPWLGPLKSALGPLGGD